MNCLITGSSLGIGNCLVKKLASLNNNIYITYLTNYNKALELQKEIINNYNVKCFIEKCDLRKEEDIKTIVNDFHNKLGNIDILVNNASISHDNLILDKAKEEFMDVLEVNLAGTFLMTKYAINYMNDNSIVINMSSTDGINTYSLYNIDYATSKSGIIILTNCFALSFPNIKFISIAPNWVDTESTMEMNQEYLKEELKRIKQKELISKDIVADKIIHIIVDKNIKSGSLIRIDGDNCE